MQPDRPALFKGRHFEGEIIIMCVRRYLRYALSLRNPEEIMAVRVDQRYYLALDSTLRAGTEPALSAACG
jgi:transposase-like protein